MDHLKIHTVIHSRYQVFDFSGRLPFSIVFGLCRRSSEDQDPRPLALNAANSILDVPYALSHKLLTLRVHNAKTKTDVEVDVGNLSSTESSDTLVLPSPVGRTENWKKALSVYHYRIGPGSELGKLFQPEKTYTIRAKEGVDLGGEGSTYVDKAEPLEEQKTSPVSSDKPKLFSSKSYGRATFTVVPSLPWPPKIETRMRRLKCQEHNVSNDGTGGGATVIEMTVLNTGTEAIAVQTRGRQRFLIPWGPMQPEEEYPGEDPRPRLIDPQTPAPASTIQVINATTKAVVRGARKPGVCGLYQKHDPRPKLETLTTLRPGEPLVRNVDVGGLLAGLPDGKYGLRVEPRGLWWCVGCWEDFATEGEDRVPHRLYSTRIPPLMLECEQMVGVQVKDGILV